MSKNLANPIYSGRTAEIYNGDQEHVLKLFHSWVALESIENEARIACTIYQSGLLVPAVGEIVRVEDRTGLIYQRIQGISMYKAAQCRPWNMIRYLKRSADLQAEIHSHRISTGLPSQRQILERQIHQAVGLPLQLRQRNWQRWLPIIAAARLVDEIPELDGMLIEQVEKYL